MVFFVLLKLHILIDSEKMANQLDFVCVVGIADEDLFGPVYHKQKSSFLEEIQIEVEILLDFASAFLQNLFLFGDWQLRMRSFGRDRQFFFSRFSEISSLEMSIE